MPVCVYLCVCVHSLQVGLASFVQGIFRMKADQARRSEGIDEKSANH